MQRFGEQLREDVHVRFGGRPAPDAGRTLRVTKPRTGGSAMARGAAVFKGSSRSRGETQTGIVLKIWVIFLFGICFRYPSGTTAIVERLAVRERP
jgi:hypothetical protein